MRATFCEFYTKILEGVSLDRTALMNYVAVVATREWRLEVIEKLEGDLQAQLTGLKERSRTLAKKLGQK